MSSSSSSPSSSHIGRYSSVSCSNSWHLVCWMFSYVKKDRQLKQDDDIESRLSDVVVVVVVVTVVPRLHFLPLIFSLSPDKSHLSWWWSDATGLEETGKMLFDWSLLVWHVISLGSVNNLHVDVSLHILSEILSVIHCISLKSSTVEL